MKVIGKVDGLVNYFVKWDNSDSERKLEVFWAWADGDNQLKQSMLGRPI